jgi:hypothetical protein
MAAGGNTLRNGRERYGASVAVVGTESSREVSRWLKGMALQLACRNPSYEQKAMAAAYKKELEEIALNYKRESGSKGAPHGKEGGQ